MGKIKYLLTIIFLVWASAAAAQFRLNTVEKSTEIAVPMNVKQVPVKVDIMNEAKERAIRKAIWRDRNLVDLKISFTGATTQFNKSWVTNNQSSISGQIVAYYYHTYTKKRFTYQFKFDGQYGMNFIDNIWFKNQDLLKIYNLASWRIKTHGLGRNWAYSFSTLFQTQFTVGHKSRTEKNIIWSNFMAPASLNAGVGFTYTSPSKKLPFVITLNPISGDMLFVLDDRIDPDRRQKLGIPVTWMPDDSGKKHPLYKNYKGEGGSTLNISFSRTFRFGEKKAVSLGYRTTLNSFYGWITNLATYDPHGNTPEIMPTLNWTNTINFDPLKFLTLQLITTMVYNKSQIDKIQMQYFLSVGLTYGYKNR